MSSILIVTLQIPNPISNYSLLNGYLINLHISLLLHTDLHCGPFCPIFFLCNCSNQLLKDKKVKARFVFH